jgi:hypothetical protein
MAGQFFSVSSWVALIIFGHLCHCGLIVHATFARRVEQNRFFPQLLTLFPPTKSASGSSISSDPE